jgi:M6 family metalloprotease-like protein
MNILFSLNHLYSAWFDNVPSQRTQPDGTKIDLFFSGDEFHHWAHDKDHFTMIQDVQTGYWCWAILTPSENVTGGLLTSSGYPVHLYAPQSLALQPRINISEALYLEKRETFENGHRSNISRAPTTGVINNLVVFILFADDSGFTTPFGFYDDIFNAVGTNANSMKQYFWDSSYQQLFVNSSFFPSPNGDFIVAYRSPNPRAYYQQYNAVTNPIGYWGGIHGVERRWREHQLLADAIHFIHDLVPIDLVIDSNGNGFVDNVCFEIRGDFDDWADLLWPHRWVLFSNEVYLHGKRVWDYNFNIEYFTNFSGVGVLAHEFAHTLGLPDFYRYNVPANPIGIWDLMAATLTPPQSLSAFSKWKYLGWTDIPLITETGSYTLFPNTVSQDNHAFRIFSPNIVTEYFIVEYRSTSTGLTDSTLPGSGLLVYRVNTQAGNGNANGPPDELYVYRPGGSPISDGNINNAFFSQQSGRISINDFTNPDSFLSNELIGGLNISNIGHAGTSISFYVEIPIESKVISPTQLSATVIDNDVMLEWEFTANTDTDTIWFTHSLSATPGTNIGSGSEHLFSVAQRFTPEYIALQGLAGMELTKVSFIGNVHEASYTVMVWIDGRSHPYFPGEVVASTFVPSNTIVAGQWHIVEIDPVKIPADKEIWIGYQVSTPFGHPAAADSGPMRSGYGNLINWSGSWVTLDSMSSTFNINWMIRGFAVSTNDNTVFEMNRGVPNNGYSRGLMGFNVYRDDVLLTPIPIFSRRFTDYDVMNGIHIYKVTASYPVGESTPASKSVNVGDVSEYNHEVDILTTRLIANYPNPFNPQTTIKFSIGINTPSASSHPSPHPVASDTPLKMGMGNSHVRLNVYNIRGQRVRTLVNGMYIAGEHSVVWNGTDDSGRSVGSGIYFYRMTTDGYSETRKMILLK